MVEDHRQAQQASQPGVGDAVGGGQRLPLLERELAAVGAYQEGQQALLGAREAGQVGVLQQVGAVAMELAVGDGQANLVQPRRPAQEAHLGLAQAPRLADLGGQRQRRGGDVVGLARVHLVAAAEVLQGLEAAVLGAVAPHQVVEHPLAQGAVGVAHALQVEGLEDGAEDRHAGGEHPRTVGLEPLHRDPVQLLALDQPAAQLGQPLAGDHPLRGVAAGGQHRRGGLDGAAGTHRVAPAKFPIGAADVGQLREGGELGPAHALLADLAVREEAPAEGDATHAQALQRQGFEAFADDELGGAAADVDDQPPSLLGQGVGRPQVDQARLLAAGDDLDAVAQLRLGALDEGLAVGRLAQGVGTHHPQVVGGDALEEGGEARQAAQRTLHGGVVQATLVVEAGGELHLLAQAGDHLQAVLLVVGHQQVEAVGAKVDGGEAARVAGALLAGDGRVRWRGHGASFGESGKRVRARRGAVNRRSRRGLRSQARLSSIEAFAFS